MVHARLKTYGDLKKNYEQFYTYNSCMGENKKKHSQQCHSTIHHPLLIENDSTFILQKCIVLELHVLQGFVNHLFWNGLIPLVGREQASIWPKKLKVISKNYQGEIFEGNACRKLLKMTDKFSDPKIYANVGNLKLVPFIVSFKAMDKIVNCCFSTKTVGTDLNNNLSEL